MLPRLEDVGVSKMQSSRWQKEASVPDDVFAKHVKDCTDGRIELTQASLLKLAGAGHVSQCTGENEWYTPAKYIEATREVMQGIDLDPASSDVAQKTVKATKYYTIADDGLSQEWAGRVWMNPPYSKELIGQFTAKLIAEIKAGRVSQAVVLVNNATETAWCQQLLSFSSATCFVASRIRFENADGEPANSPLQGQVFVYFGESPAIFISTFAQLGVCVITSATNEKTPAARAAGAMEPSAGVKQLKVCGNGSQFERTRKPVFSRRCQRHSARSF